MAVRVEFSISVFSKLSSSVRSWEVTVLTGGLEAHGFQSPGFLRAARVQVLVRLCESRCPATASTWQLLSARGGEVRGNSGSVVVGPVQCGQGYLQRGACLAVSPVVGKQSSALERGRPAAPLWALVLPQVVFTGTLCAGTAASPPPRGRRAQSGAQLARYP